jgi:DNA repair exonuclease SbcCD ATPase subunit
VRIDSCIVSFDGGIGGNELSFGPGVTVVYGPNGSGKTRFSRALSSLLWQNGNCAGEDFLWDRVFLSATVSSGNESIRLIRNKNKSLSIRKIGAEEKEITFQDITPEGSMRLQRDVLAEFSSRLAKEIFRFSPGSFEATSLLASPLDGPVAADTACFHQYFIDDGSMFIHAFDTLRSSDSPAYKALIREISDHEAEHKRIRKEIDIIDLVSTRTRKLREEKEQIGRDIEQLKSRLGRFTDASSKTARHRELSGEIEKIDSEIKEIENNIAGETEKISSFARTKKNLERVFPQFSNFSEIQRNNLSKIQHAFITVKRAHDRYDQSASEFRAEGKKCVKRIIVSGIILFAAPIAVIAAGSAVSDTIRTSALISGAALFIAASAVSLIAAHSGRKKIPLAGNLAKKNETEEELRSILRENNISIDSFSVNEAYEFLLQYFEEYGSFSEQEDEAYSLGQTLKTDEYFGEMDRNLSRLRSSLSERTGESVSCLKEAASLSGYGSDESPSALAEFIAGEISSLESQIESCREINDKLCNEIEREEPKGDSDGLHKIYERIGSRIQELNNLKNSIEFARDLLERSSAEREKRLLSKAVSAALPLFHELTLNRYVSSITEETFIAFITSSGKIEDPSAGHGMLLAFKLALTGIMEEESFVPPLILDEPTANMDSDRIKKFIEITGRYAEKRQIIILSHNREAYQGIFPLVEFIK